MSFYFSRKVSWVRFVGVLVSVENTVKLFSERNGFVKSIRLPFGYRATLRKIRDK